MLAQPLYEEIDQFELVCEVEGRHLLATPDMLKLAGEGRMPMQERIASGKVALKVRWQATRNFRGP